MFRFLACGMLIIWSICFTPSFLHGGSLSPDCGTLIVTYQTDQPGESLERIRFWLVNPQEERTLYPKKEGFVSNSHMPNERTVVITDLPVGDYRIEFLIPHTIGPYEEVPSKTVSLTTGSVIKLDQTIHLRPSLSTFKQGRK